MRYDTDSELLEAAYVEVLKEAKTYIVYVDGDEVGTIKAGSHNAAEKKAKLKHPGKNVSVSYTEESVQHDETLTEGTHKCDKCGKPMGKHHNEEKAKKGYKYCQNCDRTYSPEAQTKINGKGISAPSINKESLDEPDMPTAETPMTDKPADEWKSKVKSELDKRLDKINSLNQTEPEYNQMPLYKLARIIQRDWKKVNYGAVPYLQAMSTLSDINDNYDMDSGRSIVAYFLSNAGTWKGPIAGAIKTELKRRLKGK